MALLDSCFFDFELFFGKSWSRFPEFWFSSSGFLQFQFLQGFSWSTQWWVSWFGFLYSGFLERVPLIKKKKESSSLCSGVITYPTSFVLHLFLLPGQWHRHQQYIFSLNSYWRYCIYTFLLMWLLYRVGVVQVFWLYIVWLVYLLRRYLWDSCYWNFSS